MTLDTTIPAAPSYIQQYGNTVSVFPADQINRIEVWRAPQLTGAPNDAASVQATVLPPSPLGGVTFIDPLPPGTGPFYYKSRHLDAAGNTSLFTSYTEALTPTLIVGAAALNPMAAFGAIVDQLPPSSLYEMRFASSYPDPDLLDGMQSYIDFVASTNFMRIGQTPVLITSSTAANPTVVTTAAAHNYLTGDQISIRGHLLNITINGSNPITVLSSVTFSVPVDTSAAVAGSGGHAVRLSLTIDGLGNLVVWGIIRAVTMVVNGVATFLGGIRSISGGALFRSLQHSTVGEYGDQTVNRVLMDSDALLLKGDAGVGQDIETARLGSYSVATSALTARTSTDVGLTAGSKGWIDSGDGSDNGVNTISGSTNGNTTVVAAKRLLQKLGDPTTEGQNVDAYDDLYKMGFRIDANYLTGGNPAAIITSTVQIEYSTDSGANWAFTGGSYVVRAGGTSSGYPATAFATFTPTVTVPGSPTHVWFRLVLTVNGNIIDSTYHSGTYDGSVYCYAASYRSSNYATTWSTSTGASQYRRGLKLPKVKQPQQVRNRDFENDMAFWFNNGTGTTAIINNAANAHSGSKYLQVTSSGAAYTDVYTVDAGGLNAYVPVVPGAVVTFSGWIYRESGTSVGHFVISTYDSAKAHVTDIGGTSVSAAAWTFVSDSYTIPASGVAYVVLIFEINNIATTVCRVDDVSMTIGTGDVPHAYLEPVDVVANDVDALEGELQFVGGTAHALAYRDDEQMRYVSRVLGAQTNKTTTSASEVKITNGVKALAGRLNAANRIIRIRAGGTIGANTGNIRAQVKINDLSGGTNIATMVLAANDKWLIDLALVVQTSGASGTVRVSGFTVHGTTIALVTGTITVDTTVDEWFNLTGDTAGAVTLTVDEFVVVHEIV